MEKSASSRIFRYLLYGGMVGAAGATALVYATSARLFLYPAATITLALFISSLLLRFEISLSLPAVKLDHRLVDVCLLLTIATLASFTGPRYDFPSVYFLLILFSSLLLAYRISSVNGCANLLYIIVLGIVIRANIWFSAPHFSRDPRIHVAITGFIKNTGRMVPLRIDDYYNYPIADIYSGMTSVVTGQDAKQALFLSLSLAGMFATVFVYLFVRRLFEQEGNRMGAYAAFLFSMSAFSIGLASGPKPQTLSATFFIVAIFATQLDSNINRALLIGVTSTVMIFTHVLAPLVLAATLLFYSVVSIILSRTKGKYGDTSQPLQYNSPFLFGTIALIMILQRYYEVGHFRIQVNRILGIFLPDSGNLQEFVGRDKPTTTSNILLDLDHLLLQSGDLLLGGLIIGISGICFLYYRVVRTEREVVPDQWVISSFLIYSAFSLFLFSQATQVRRASVVLLAVTAPAAAYSLYWIRHRWQTVGTVVIILIMISGAFFGIANPGVYKMERTSGFVPTLHSPDVVAIEHVENNRSVTQSRPMAYTDGYTAASAYFEAVEDGYDRSKFQYSSNRVSGLRALQTDSTDVKEILNKQGDPVYIYRTYYERYSGLKPPPGSDVIYSSGKAQVLS